jgi:hypothetical protein
MFVRSLSPPKPAGLDPQIFAGILQIGRGTMIAKKYLKKIFHGKFSEIFLVKFLLVQLFHEIAERSVAISEYDILSSKKGYVRGLIILKRLSPI